MKTKFLNGRKYGKKLRCRLIKNGMSRPGDILCDPNGLLLPFFTDISAVISEEARRGGQFDVYRPINPTPKKSKPWESFSTGPKPVRAWGWQYREKLLPEAEEFKPVGTHRFDGANRDWCKLVRVLITPIPKGRKA